MWGKINHHVIKQRISKVKNRMVNGYYHAENAFQTLDNAVKAGKHIYSIVAPALEQHG